MTPLHSLGGRSSLGHVTKRGFRSTAARTCDALNWNFKGVRAVIKSQHYNQPGWMAGMHDCTALPLRVMREPCCDCASQAAGDGSLINGE